MTHVTIHIKIFEQISLKAMQVYTALLLTIFRFFSNSSMPTTRNRQDDHDRAKR